MTDEWSEIKIDKWLANDCYIISKSLSIQYKEK